MTVAEAVVIQFPGVNCEYETKRVLEAAGIPARICRWNADPAVVRGASAIVLPGGFSYQDRIRAGVVAAKDSVLDAVVEAADAGVPVLGICNGAQILVESGVVPGFSPGAVEVALAPNRMSDRAGYYCNWVTLKKGSADCIFTAFLDEEPSRAVPIPMAHGEGRFVTSSPDVDAQLARGERVALVYATSAGDVASDFPDNPNGSSYAIAALTNEAGNVLAIMPHPERAAWYHQVPRRVGGKWGMGRGSLGSGELFAPGPGMGFFTSLKKALA